MDVPLVLAQIEATRRTVTAIVFGLLAVAAALALLTAWYWRVTDPRRDRSSKQMPPPRGKGPKERAPDPDRPSGDALDPSDPSGARPMERVIAAGPDQTRVMDREAILDLDSDQVPSPPPPTPPRSVATDLSAPADSDDKRVSQPVPLQRDLNVTELPEAQSSRVVDSPESATDEEIDLRPDPAPVSKPGADGSHGAHDNGVSFDEWLAMAEDD